MTDSRYTDSTSTTEDSSVVVLSSGTNQARFEYTGAREQHITLVLSDLSEDDPQRERRSSVYWAHNRYLSLVKEGWQPDPADRMVLTKDGQKIRFTRTEGLGSGARVILSEIDPTTGRAKIWHSKWHSAKWVREYQAELLKKGWKRG